jgi:hypothetical protein
VPNSRGRPSQTQTSPRKAGIAFAAGVSAVRAKRGLAAAIGWGIALWVTGYALGIGLYFLVPLSLLGWVIMPIGAA